MNTTTTTTRTHTYTHRFKDGTRATLSLPAFMVEWEPKGHAALIPEYLVWRDACIENYAEITGLRIAVVTL